jgi:hypothetical protein
MLTDEHLLAEHREIKRLPSVYGKFTKKDIPQVFTLGKGHVKFFLDKYKYTHKRYNKIYWECLQRGFRVEDYSSNWNIVEQEDYNDYNPTEADNMLLKMRIIERIHNSKKEFFHYYGQKITKQEAIDLLCGIKYSTFF